uniref:hypothetical protein n=1 Tax=uncultured Sphingomonas sp. TaxID=158754 RepID=UPI0035CAD9A9
MASLALLEHVRPANSLCRIGDTSLAVIAGTMLAPPRSAIAAEMARFAAMTEAWDDMAEAAQCEDERDYRAAKARFCAAAEGR